MNSHQRRTLRRKAFKQGADAEKKMMFPQMETTANPYWPSNAQRGWWRKTRSWIGKQAYEEGWRQSFKEREK